MPITPFHFGPGAAFHSVAPKHASFLAFCAANVFVDVEPLYYMVTDQFPLHRFFHTYVGVSIVIAFTIALFVAARKLAAFISLPNLFNWRQLSAKAVAVGAALGGYSHIVFDSIMHSDMRPFAPFSDTNPFLHIVSLEMLHWLCVAAGIVGLAVLGIRKVLSAP